MRDIAAALDLLVPAAAYGGSLIANNRSAYDALRWKDTRPKPTWAEIEAATSAPVPPAPLPAWAFWGVVDDTPGLRATIEAAIDAIPDEVQRRTLRGKLAASQTFSRGSAEIEAARSALGMTKEQIDALWAQGEALVAAVEG